jgi:hypothetical protein
MANNLLEYLALATQVRESELEALASLPATPLEEAEHDISEDKYLSVMLSDAACFARATSFTPAVRNLASLTLAIL